MKLLLLNVKILNNLRLNKKIMIHIFNEDYFLVKNKNKMKKKKILKKNKVLNNNKLLLI